MNTADGSHSSVGADRIRVAVNSPRMLQPVPTPYTPVSLWFLKY